MLLNKSYLFIALLGLSTQVAAESLRDPTLPGKGVAGSGASFSNRQQALVLQSIVNSGSSAYAVINNKILSVGDSIQGVKVVRITSTAVSLSDGRKLALFKAITE
ncbi:MSHA biogenesis protein MshK [Shewanella sp. A25]|nr:MSHA biogenesis protein MshK [Shewanella shenzhenensis]